MLNITSQRNIRNVTGNIGKQRPIKYLTENAKNVTGSQRNIKYIRENIIDVTGLRSNLLTQSRCANYFARLLRMS